MFNRLDWYLVRNTLGLFVGLLGLAVCILLVERLVRLTEILSDADNPAFNAVRLISSLLPHYFELALPGVMLLATLLTISRLSRSGEITAMLASGVSLYRVSRPFVAIGFVLAIISILTSGYLQPLTRYNYRSVVFELSQDNIVAAFKDFQFVQFDDWTIWTDGIDTDAMTLGETFIFQKADDGTTRFTVGRAGQLQSTEEGGWVISLEDAMVGDVPAEIADGYSNHASANRINWQAPTNLEAFRNRGFDERELTLTELITKSYQTAEFELDPAVATAEMHDRLARAALLVVLAFTGIFLGLNLGRNTRIGGMVTGIIVLLAVQKLLEFGLVRAQQGVVAPWAGAWPVLLMLTCGTMIFFARANGAQYRRFGLRIYRPNRHDPADDSPSGE